MKLFMTVFMTLMCLQPLRYGIQSLTRLSRQQRKLYPLLRIKYPEGIQSLITMKETVYRCPASSLYS